MDYESKLGPVSGVSEGEFSLDAAATPANFAAQAAVPDITARAGLLPEGAIVLQPGLSNAVVLP